MLFKCLLFLVNWCFSREAIAKSELNVHKGSCTANNV
nr:MAG TPA: hypothetical protein [Caudoviricetes sp.]